MVKCKNFMEMSSKSYDYLGYLQEKGLFLELSRRLYNKCSLKVLKYLGKKGGAIIFEVRDFIKDVNVLIPWSREK